VNLLEHDIRWSEPEDINYMNLWFSSSESCDPFPFGPEEKVDALKNWIGFSRFKSSLTVTVDQVPCAIGTLFLMPYKKVAHQCSFYLIVDPNKRNRGLGSSLVKNLLHLAKTYFHLESVHCELIEPSLLLSILQKQGFEMFVRQEGYAEIRGEIRARLLLERSLI
jgi:hypothetical protein